MKLDVEVRELGRVDHHALKAAVAETAPEVWLEDTLRQSKFSNVHAQTRSIVLLFCDGWPSITVTRRSGWDRFAGHAIPLMQSILSTHYKPKGTIIRAMVAKLLAGGVIARHRDAHPSFAVGHRIHVPLVTNDNVDFAVGSSIYNLKEGIAYEISNLDEHGVHNRSSEDRVHFIFDYVET